MRHQATQALYDYWNEVRHGRVAPQRLEIQPARIASLLLDTFILERSEHDVYRFRLAGTRICARFGMELRSANFLDCWQEGDRGMLEHHLTAIVDLGRGGLFTGEAEFPVQAGPERRTHEPKLFEMIVLPLVHTGNAIDRLLCHLVPLDEPERDRIERVASLRLIAAQPIWPDGEPSEGAFSYNSRQSPLSPHVRMARIVRQGRRQFRVYEGGLSGR
jgi:hypothetical protein